MAHCRTGSDCCRRVLLTVLLGVAALGSSLGCRQTPIVPRPAARTSSPYADATAPSGWTNSPSTGARGQSPSGPPLPGLEPRPTPSGGAAAEESAPQVVEVRIVGPHQTPDEEILRQIHTRPGRTYDPEEIEGDVRRLSRTRKFVEVVPRYRDVAGGRIVIFEVLERPVLRYVKFVGNEPTLTSTWKSAKNLRKESGIESGEAMDPFAVEEGRRRIEELYHEKGYAQARVTIAEGTESSDRGAVYVINEGPRKRVLWTRFVGNTFASDAKLRTKIQSKPGIFWIFNGQVDRKKLDEDVVRLTDYYKGLGFFRARVSALPPNPAKNWQLMTFVIDEGPRYVVENVTFQGNVKIGDGQLSEELKLTPGKYFSQAEMRSDRAAVVEEYGAIGHIFADVEPEVKFYPEPGKLDLVYRIQEGEPYRVGRIDVNILGENPHTRISTVLNRLSLAPGDLVDVRELRASERRLKASGLFEYDPMRGVTPQIVVKPPELDDLETGIARQPESPPRHRGQSPDPTTHRAFRPPYPADPAHAPQPDAPPGRVVNLRVRGGRARLLLPLDEPSSTNARCASSADEQIVIRGQYSADAGRTMPGLPRSEPALPAQPYPYPQGGYPAAGSSQAPASTEPIYGTTPNDRAPASAAQGYPAPGASAPAPTTAPQTAAPGAQGYPYPGYGPSGGSATYNTAPPPTGTQPAPGGMPGSATAPSSPGYGNQFAPGSAAPPPGSFQPQEVFPPGGATIDDATGLLGAPPSEDPPLYVPLQPEVYETRTGRLMFSVGINSEAGLLGSVIVDEQNFDIWRFPRSWEDIRRGTAWRGAGQRFRIEAVPGTEVQKYTVSFTEPYLFDTPVSLGTSAYFYNRYYEEWDEERLGGRVSLGYQFTHDLSGSLAFRGAKIEIYDPIQVYDPITTNMRTPPELTEVLGSNALYGFRAQLAHDTRDSRFLATEGHYFEIGVEQVTGTFDYTRGDIDLRRYFMLRQHPDGSGRHVLSTNFRASITSDDTPIYEHYYAGGFSTIRGFDFRGASHRDPATGVRVGGHFMMLASIEYMFPITADDNIRGVVFCDSGTVEPSIDDWTDKYRVAPGVGLRLLIPAMGPAPIALDFAFPVSSEDGDEEEIFSFFIGLLR